MRPHAPQFVGSFDSSTQYRLGLPGIGQLVCVPVHDGPVPARRQVPSVQYCPAAHVWPQSPQSANPFMKGAQ